VTVRILFFGPVREITGVSEDLAVLPPGSTLADLFSSYARRFPRLAEMSGSLVLARNQQFGDRAQALEEGDEVAFLPPVSGGSGAWIEKIEDPAGNFYALTREPIDARALSQRLLQGLDGAIVTFEGVVRDNSHGRRTRFLDYQCYESMAIRVLADIGSALAAAHPISRIALVHRVGRMEIGEASVAVVVTAPHRKPAFEAALEAINRIKKLVPVWKKEYFEDGEVWVEGDWDPSVVQR
jgi:molybdopterin synthase catalytic subunit